MYQKLRTLLGIPTFVDRAVLQLRDLTMPAGDAETAVRMRSAEYRRLAAPRLGEFTVAGSLVAAGAVAGTLRTRWRAGPKRPGRTAATARGGRR
jgi:hypothetical protein